MAWLAAGFYSAAGVTACSECDAFSVSAGGASSCQSEQSPARHASCFASSFGVAWLCCAWLPNRCGRSCLRLPSYWALSSGQPAPPALPSLALARARSACPAPSPTHRCPSAWPAPTATRPLPTTSRCTLDAERCWRDLPNSPLVVCSFCSGGATKCEPCPAGTRINGVVCSGVHRTAVDGRSFAPHALPSFPCVSSLRVQRAQLNV